MLFWIICFAVAILQQGQVWCQLRDNTPPSMWFDRNWRIPSSEPVNSVVTRVHASDNENDTLEFGLEPVFIAGANPSDTKHIKLPFRVDNRTGVVYVNESLKEWEGKNIMLYVTLSDGKLTVKNEVWVNIVKEQTGPLNPVKPPSYLPLPNFGNIPKIPPPPQLPSSGIPNRYPSKHTTTLTQIQGNTSKYAKDDLSLRPTNDRGSHNEYILGSTTQNIISTVRSVLLDQNINEIGGNLSKYPADLPVKSEIDLTMTLVPILSVCAIFLAVGVIAFVFRKKIYLGRSKGSKEDMRKETNGGIVLQEDPSLAMQHWRGPRAFSNRYEPWELEGNLNQTSIQNGVILKPSDHWEFPRHRLKVFNILGEGAFGQVWKCEALDIDNKDGVSVVAVKTLKENATEKERTDLISELQVMKTLEPHPNVVRLIGCCTEKDPLFVIMEYISKGKLQSFLRNSRAERYYGNMHGKSKSLTSRDLTSFVYQVARGMDYLSSRGIIHRDLAARNVLISEEHTCKVADFGFARDVVSTHIYERKSEGRLPIRWMAPESLYDNIFSVKSDVWSFGVLIWEVVTLGSTPYPGLSAADVMRKVRDGHRLDKPEHCRRELYNIMYYCWDQDPKKRPTFTECVELLEKLLLTETDYIELERFPDHSYYNMLSLSGEKL